MKVVINNCYGGFSLSDEGTEAYLKAKYPNSTITKEKSEYNFAGDDFYLDGEFFSNREITRDDAELVRVVEELGKAADGMCAKLKIVEIPDDISWEIEEYDGMEWVSEVHRTWS